MAKCPRQLPERVCSNGNARKNLTVFIDLDMVIWAGMNNGAFIKYIRGLQGRLVDLGLGSPALGVLMEVLTYWNGDPKSSIFPSPSTISRGTRLTTRSVRRIWKDIEKAGLLVKTAQGGGRSVSNAWMVTPLLERILKNDEQD